MLAEAEMVRNIGQLLGLPLLHVENHERWRSMAENPLRELPQPITPARCEKTWLRIKEKLTKLRELKDFRCVTQALSRRGVWGRRIHPRLTGLGLCEAAHEEG